MKSETRDPRAEEKSEGRNPKSEGRGRGRLSVVSWLVLVALGASLFATGCTSTVTPKPISSTAASWDGGEQNSGLIGKDSRAGYFLVTEHWRERYNGLVGLYGNCYVPPLKVDEGIAATATNGVYRVDGQRVGKYIQMGFWFKEGKKVNPNPEGRNPEG